MSCFHPITAFRSAEIALSGKRKLVFDKSKAINSTSQQISCGQCTGCRLERSRQWMVRILHESTLHDKNMFLTATYEPGTEPTTHEESVRDFQLFMKKIRSHYPEQKITFYHVAENGTENDRHHHHAIIFNFEFPDKKFKYLSDNVSKNRGFINYGSKKNRDVQFYKPLQPISAIPGLNRIESHAPGAVFESEILTKLWGKGICDFGSVTPQSAGYVARYSMTKMNGEKAEKHYQRLDPETGELFQLIPEYSTMSRRPGIGKQWFDKYKTDVYPSDQIIIDGRRVKPPKYYDKLIEDLMPDMLEDIKFERIKQAKTHKEDQTPRRLAEREFIKRKSAGTLKRSV